jgi:hypothetical protein
MREQHVFDTRRRKTRAVATLSHFAPQIRGGWPQVFSVDSLYEPQGVGNRAQNYAVGDVNGGTVIVPILRQHLVADLVIAFAV